MDFDKSVPIQYHTSTKLVLCIIIILILWGINQSINFKKAFLIYDIRMYIRIMYNNYFDFLRDQSISKQLFYFMTFSMYIRMVSEAKIYHVLNLTLPN